MPADLIRAENISRDPALIEFIKNKPGKAALILAGLVASVAAVVLFSIFLPPALPVVLVVAFSCIALLYSTPSLITLHSEIKKILFERFKQDHSKHHTLQNKPIVLFLESIADHNGAYKNDSREYLNYLKEHNYKVVFKKISKIDEIEKNIRKVHRNKNNIKAIFIRAHGSPEVIELGNTKVIEGSINAYNAHSLSSAFHKLNPGTPIVLDSCRTAGIPKDKSINIAQRISHVAKHCNVIAASRSLTYESLTYDKKNPLTNFRFHVPKHKSKNFFLKYPSLFINILKSKIFYSIGRSNCAKGLVQDATVIYKAGQIIT